MPQANSHGLERDVPSVEVSRWWGVLLIALTYVYFLIFAQFAFLKRLQELSIVDAYLKVVMGAMALGGIGLSLLAPRISLHPSPQLRIRQSLAVCALAAVLTLLRLDLLGSILVSFLIGCGLGLLTVTLVTHLRVVLGDRNNLVKVGLGTGIGYLCCNLPILFTASPQSQAIVAAVICFAGIFVPIEHKALNESLSECPTISRVPLAQSLFFAAALAGFTALVWLDSAAFFIIQNTPALKAGTWEGSLHLWANGALHLSAALASAWLLRRRGLLPVLILSLLALGSACLLLLDPGRVFAASLLYPIGVSLYSVALVAYPALLAPASTLSVRGRQAGWIYAVAGWFGSAMGIGMGQNLGHVPAWFVLLAGVVVLTPLIVLQLRLRMREITATLLVLASAWLTDRAMKTPASGDDEMSAVQRGRQVYIAEGCIHCHSQYVRPNSPDTLMWGPVQSMDELRDEQPPLIGNRRQGPDLSEVGNRRSLLWLKAHLMDPRQVSYASFMPAYAYLFKNRKGDDLVAYLGSLRNADSNMRLVAEGNWHLPSDALAKANDGKGERLFLNYCATCHDTNGAARQCWKAQFKRLPPDLLIGPLQDLPATETAPQRLNRVAHIVKFGVPGTDMPGHEYLPDSEVASIGLWLSQVTAQPNQNQQSALIPGERK